MASFNLNSTTTSAQTLVGNEIGILGPNGSIQTLYASAINLGERSGLSIAGSVISAGGHAVAATGILDAVINVAPTGSIISTYIPDISVNTISVTFVESFVLNSAGAIMSNATAVRASGGADAEAEVVNSGLIQSTQDAVNLSVGARGTVSFWNGGTIVATDDAVRISTDPFGGAEIVNSGQIEGLRFGLSLGAGVSEILNTGSIVGQQGSIVADPSSGNAVVLTNQGTISGDMLATRQDDVVVNRGGLIQGDVQMSLGNDMFNTRGGEVIGEVDLNSGDDTYRGSDGADHVLGGSDDDHLTGYAGDDTLLGDAGFDTLIGNSGHDRLDGGGRNDRLIGGKGDDTMTGGGGSDTFVIRRVGNGDDEVTDFQNGLDRVDISALGVQNFNALKNTFNALSQTTDGVVVDLAAAGGSGSILLVGMTLADTEASDFIF